MVDGRITTSWIVAALALAGLVSGCGGGGGPVDVFAGSNYPHPHDYPIHGIDVSKFQGDIDWNSVANSGVKFAYIKASEGGDHLDERFQANWDGAKAAGIQRGAYHFVYWCRPPMEEMANFEQAAPVDPDALPPVLDVEATPTSKTCKKRLTQAGAIADMRVMLEEMERHYGKRPVIYSTVDFYQAILSDGAFMDYPIWVRSTKYHPSVRYPGRPWAFWQYQSDAYVNGIRPKVDRNAFFGTKAQWEAFLKEPNIRMATAVDAAATAIDPKAAAGEQMKDGTLVQPEAPDPPQAQPATAAAEAPQAPQDAAVAGPAPPEDVAPEPQAPTPVAGAPPG
jgi:lysozyme